jgi:hypothetical protein
MGGEGCGAWGCRFREIALLPFLQHVLVFVSEGQSEDSIFLSEDMIF